MGLTWGIPAAFWLGLIALPVIAMFLFRRRSKVMEVPAVIVWTDLGQPVDSRSISSILRRLLVLLLELLLLALLILSIADPSPRRPPPGRLILVLDVGATLQTDERSSDTAGANTRMDLARAEAQKALDVFHDLQPEQRGDGPGREIMLIQAGAAPILALPATSDLASALKAVAATRSLDVDSDLRRAIDAAGAFVDPHSSTEVVVISDFATENPRALYEGWQAPAELRLVRIGHFHPDAAIVSLWSGPDGVNRRIVAGIAQTGLTGKKTTAELSVDGRRVASREVTLAAGRTTAAFSAPMAPGSDYEVKILPPPGDRLAVDDVARGVVPPLEAASVCLVSDGNPALVRALHADPSVQLRIVAPAEYHGPAGDPVVILDGPKSAAAAAAASGASETRGYLMVHCADPLGYAKLGSPVDLPPVSHWAGSHPCLANTDPSLFNIPRGFRIDWQSGANSKELVGADTLPVIAEAGAGPGGPSGKPGVRCLYWLFDPADTDLPRRVSFPLLLWDAIDYLATGGVEPRPESLRTGQPLLVTANHDAGSPPPTLTGPAGDPLTVKPGGEGWIASETTRQGIYLSRDANGAEQKYALNLLSPRGAQAVPEGPEDAPVDRHKLTDAKAELSWWQKLRRHLTWQTLLACAAGLALAEWALYNWRVIRIG